MRAEADFVDTIVRLMRLTHQQKLVWQREQDASPSFELYPTYSAEINGLQFSLEDEARRPELRSERAEPPDEIFGVPVLRLPERSGQPVYRLVINDLDSGELIVSPPLHAAEDLVAVVRGYDHDTLSEINRRLDSVL